MATVTAYRGPYRATLMNTQPQTIPRTRTSRLILSPRDLGLYAITVFAWSTSWIALKLQVGQVPV